MAPYLDDERLSLEDDTEELSMGGDTDVDSSDYLNNDNTDFDSDDEVEAVIATENPDLRARASEINQWYQNVASRRVDLVGDYAGNELFLIEGDSMLQRCFSDPKLDFKKGFQMVHAVYNVEKLLQNLVQRKCNFHLVFLDDHEGLCVPITARQWQSGKYLLARAIVLQHLQQHLSKSVPGSKVSQFKSIEDPAFQDYLKKSGMYFIMAHDGAQPLPRAPKDTEINKKAQALRDVQERRAISHQIQLRSSIATYMRLGYNVALLNGLDWQDTKVMMMVLEIRSRGVPKFAITSSNESTIAQSPSKVDFAGLREQLSILVEESNHFQGRHILSLLVLAQMVKEDPREKTFATQYLYHIACLTHLALNSRHVISNTLTEPTRCSLAKFSDTCGHLLRDHNIISTIATNELSDTLVDLVDGRLLNLIIKNGKSSISRIFDEKTVLAIDGEFKDLSHTLRRLSDCAIASDALTDTTNGGSKAKQTKADNDLNAVKVLPFANTVFDKHLSSVHLTVDDAINSASYDKSSRIFQELSHWHNSAKPLTSKAMMKTPSKDKEWWALRREQWFMAEMQKYAASLTNAVGISLEPETIIVGSGKSEALKEQSTNKVVQPKQKNEKNARKQAMLADIAAKSQRKDEASSEKVVRAWHIACKSFDAEKDLRARYSLTKDYKATLSPSKSEVIGAEVELFMLNILVAMWIKHCKSDRRQEGLGVAAMCFDALNRFLECKKGMTKQIVQAVSEVQRSLELPEMIMFKEDTDRALPFLKILPAQNLNVAIPMSATIFQLTHCGPYMDRSIDAQIDSRVPFSPDGWQRRVLDGIDARRSLLVVAPTSAGKTFISFYAMKQVLESDDDGV